MLRTRPTVEEIPAMELDKLSDQIVSDCRPVVIRGAVSDWPLVKAARHSDDAAVHYLEQFYNGRPVRAIVAPPAEKGRFFYRPDSKLMNFEAKVAQLSQVLAVLLQQKDSDASPGIAVQGLAAAEILPGLEQANPERLLPKPIAARLWIGNKVTVAPHFDVADNLACVVAGRRRFTLFPPEQTPNIYPGPMDVTPANVPIGMVSLDEPDLARFPRYREAMEASFVADLEPGDAIHIPYMWWHGVESLTGFNILMNYWWNGDEASARYPFVSFLRVAYGLYRDMPAAHREAWRAIYDHYVFGTGGDPMEALSPSHRDKCQIAPESVPRLPELLRDLLD